MIPDPPPGQDPIDPQGVFSPPPAAPASGKAPPPVPPPAAWPPYYPPPPRGRSFTRGIFVTLATTIFGLSLALNFFLLIQLGLTGEGITRQTILESGQVNQKIALIPLGGTLLDAQSRQFDRFMRAVEKDEHVKALVLEIDTPGGSVTASDEIYQRILRYKKNHPGVPVVAALGGMATSGGYYVACAADQIFAQPTTMTGNIGVLLPRFNVSRLMDKWGIEETTIESTGATFKNAGSMFRPEKPEDRAYLQALADEAFAQFKSVVRTGRSGRLTAGIEQVANGKVYMAREALALKLVDAVGYTADAWQWAASKAGMNKPQVVRFHEPPGLAQLLTGSWKGPRPSASADFGPVRVQVDGDLLRDGLAPRPMYLWRGE